MPSDLREFRDKNGLTIVGLCQGVTDIVRYGIHIVHGVAQIVHDRLQPAEFSEKVCHLVRERHFQKIYAPVSLAHLFFQIFYALLACRV